MSLFKPERLDDIDKTLAAVVRHAAEGLPFDLIVVEGRRSKARQADLYAQGRTKPGKVVTWTLKSKHIDGQAVDLAPMKGGAIDWTSLKKFDAINTAMQGAALALKVKIRWGADWNQNGKIRERGETDSPHWELV